MKLMIVKIGNSQGIRLPKAILEQCKFGAVIEAEVKEGALVLSAIKKPRQGWALAFKDMAMRGDDELLDADVLSDEDWQW